MLGGELVVIDAVNDGQIRILAGRRNQHLARAGGQMLRRIVALREDTGAFQRHVDAEVAPRQLRRVELGKHLDGARADIENAALNRDIAGEGAMHRIIFQEMRIGLDRSQIVERDDGDIVPSGFMYRPKDIAADPAKPVNAHPNSHAALRSDPVRYLPNGLTREGLIRNGEVGKPTGGLSWRGGRG